MTRLPIGVREFAVPLRREGSLTSGSGPTLLPLDFGQEIHTRIQDRLRAADPLYQAEYPLQQTFKEGSVQLHIRGRCDGFFNHEQPLLEEIKSTHRWTTLQKELLQNPDHPYVLQLKVYGYFHWQKTKKVPELHLRLVCMQTLQEEVMPVEFQPEEFQVWVEARCTQIVAELKRFRGITKNRHRLSKKIFFPFPEPRPSQVQLMGSVTSALENDQHLLLQAPTGLGKTAGVLVPALVHALARGSPVVYIAPKNSQFQAAVDLVAIFHKQRLGLKVLVLTSKAKACRQAEVNCHESLCTFAKDYHSKVETHGLLPRDSKKNLWDCRYFQNLSQRFEICPYEISMERLREADLVICDYNYIFSPFANYLTRYEDPILPLPDPVLVIDEAHNLPERVRDAYSVEIRLSTLQNPALPKALVRKAKELFEGVRPAQAEARIDIDAKAVKALLAECLKGMIERWSEHGLPTHEDPLFEFYMALTALNQMLEQPRDAVPLIYKREGGDTIIKALCLDPSGFIQPILDQFSGVVAFSATLKPFAFYRDIAGFDPEKTTCVELSSPFPREHKKILIIPQVQTSLRERERHYPRIAQIIQKVVAIKPGPSLVFFSSYGFMRQVQTELQKLQPDWTIFTQNNAMSTDALHDLWQVIQDTEGVLLILAVQGGSLAEGIDFKGRGIQNVFIVGPALPTANFERHLMQDYFDKKYRRGRPYTYTYPAMTRSIQAAGRIVRDAGERGVIILMDPRFLEADYQETMPTDWFHETARELVSTQIIRDVDDFWTAQEHPS
ncbi:MAG TPA: ATP-dependent DNA helicase [Oligoflexus sp.]|uniref:ATP-dependent DNA helicase n=1 Tax=Oligoflexus sp. TaxID=1971216 RepID=UPI002D586251|nr:ATP-dependent DNA helicase [Oligoflexus sp.]HYX34405.1 ATP-dependent DNA helicase [Oligoflexus sp.]